MYEVSAIINDVEVRKINLLPSFELDVERILESCDKHSKLLFICSPNNPTANSFHADDVEVIDSKIFRHCGY
jgi:histidinol-phosphate aminotransferase